MTLPARSARNYVREPKLPQYQIRFAVTRIDRDRAIRIVGNVSLGQVPCSTAVVVPCAKVDGAVRAERNEQTAAEDPGVRTIACILVAYRLELPVRVAQSRSGRETRVRDS